MRLSTRVRYAARALAAIAAATDDTPLSVRKIADIEGISAKYLENILVVLGSAGVVRAVRGKRGGYELARSAESITLREVYEALDGSVAPVDCVDHRRTCSRVKSCPTRDTWVEIKEAVCRVLEQTTVRDLAERRRASSSAS